jgi:Domain of Unknown Function with PDB structure (DUF3857)/Transglutaminase-like superfamily
MHKLILFAAFFLLSLMPVMAADEAPAWLQQAAATKTGTYDKDVDAVVLLNDQAVVLSSDGRITTTTTVAIRILTHEGRAHAEAAEAYVTQSGRVRELTAWIIRPNGFVKKFGESATVDAISDPNDIYNEVRFKSIDATGDADAGVVFGYQSVSEERPLFNQDVWSFQDRLPAVVSRYSLNLPAGWRATGVVFNHANVEPTVSGSSYVWELRDLQPIKRETASPSVRNLAPRLAINYFPGAGVAANSYKTFETWAQVSRWATDLHDPQAIPEETVAAKARALTANSKTELERITAIARFVQGLQYISIDIGLGKGNGYRPHAASQVLAKSYGDCKDKANLMRAMLKAVGITAYPVIIFSGDPTLVKEEWPSPTQFNHCIIAVKISDETQSATVIQHPILGRLLIFDATDESTALGDLPDHEQGSFALLVAGDSGSLMKMPVLSPALSQLERATDVILASDGSITANLKERSIGQTAVDERRAYRHLSSTAYKGMIENWVTQGASGAKVSKLQPVDDSDGTGFGLDVDFSAGAYAKSMQDRLLVFKPAIVSRRDSVFLTEPTRQHPVVLDSHAFSETVRVKLPEGFDVDELPDAVKLEAPFGSYATKYEVKDGQLFFSRTLAQRATTIPAAQYQSVRSFFDRIRAAEQAPVVLLKK